jgi:hypothetical protein
VLGGTHCASYEISVSVIENGQPCQEAPHYSSGNARIGTVHAMVPDHFYLGSCAGNAWHAMYVDVAMSNMVNNLIFELEDLSAERRVDGALKIYMWGGDWHNFDSSRAEYFTSQAYALGPCRRKASQPSPSPCMPELAPHAILTRSGDDRMT